MKCKHVLLIWLDRMKDSLNVDIEEYALQTVLHIYNEKDTNSWFSIETQQL